MSNDLGINPATDDILNVIKKDVDKKGDDGGGLFDMDPFKGLDDEYKKGPGSTIEEKKEEKKDEKKDTSSSPKKDEKKEAKIADPFGSPPPDSPLDDLSSIKAST